MAEDFREPHPDTRSVEDRRRAEIAAEALRQSESALYTSTMIFMWLRCVRWQHKAVLVTPIVLTALAGFSYIQDVIPAWGVALMAFFSTLVPSLAEALEIQTHVDELKRAAAEYKALQDRFRRLAKVTSIGDPDKAEAELSELMDRMDIIRSSSITPPERYFEEAQRKIKRGDYDFSIDIALREAAAKGLVSSMDRPSCERRELLRRHSG